MEVAIIFAAIALMGVGFMVWFLIALLREGVPSICYWVVPVRRERESHIPATLTRIHVDDGCLATQFKYDDYYLESLENEGHAEEYG
jgi:hypothetical protein